MSNRENLKLHFPNMIPVAEAPSCPAHQDWYEWASFERSKQYSALDSKGNVWSVQNPNAWKRTTDSQGHVVLQRQAPDLVMKASDYKALSGGSSYERKKKTFDDI
jgi:hypothetical protein